MALGEAGSSAGLAQLNLASRQEAKNAMKSTDMALERVNRELGSIGAIASRLSSAVNNLSDGRNNFLAAESRIIDADVADKSAQLVKNKILQSAAAAVLGQANQLPELALKLLEVP